jgi:hypothetical protein
VLIDGLPGTPDGISRSRDGNAFWVSFVSNIPPITKWFGSALVRGILGHIPENMRPQVGERSRAVNQRRDYASCASW